MPKRNLSPPVIEVIAGASFLTSDGPEVKATVAMVEPALFFTIAVAIPLTSKRHEA